MTHLFVTRGVGVMGPAFLRLALAGRQLAAWLAPVACLLAACTLAAAQQTAPAPVVLPLRDLHLGHGAGAAALAADGRRLYVGLRDSYRADRRNLAVFTLDPDGRPVGACRRYADSAVALTEKAHATVQAILVDDARRKLYLASTLMAARPPDVGRLLTVYDLDAGGEPVGPPRSYEAGNPHHSLQALARHPRRGRLYLVGWGGAAVYVYTLDERGEPQGPPRAFPTGGGQGKYEVAVSADGKRLYLGTYPDTLEVVALDANGMPAGKARSFAAGPERAYLRFRYGPRALYLTRQTPDGPRLAVWPLATRGLPVGKPRIRADLPVSALAVGPGGKRLWAALDETARDAFTGKASVVGVRLVDLPLGADGMPASPGKRMAVPRGDLPPQAGALVTVGAGGTPVLLTESPARIPVVNRTRGWRLRLTILEVRPGKGKPAERVQAGFRFAGAREEKLGALRIGQPSAWVRLDPYLKDRRGQGLGYAALALPPVPAAARVRIEVAEGDPAAGGKLLKSLEETFQGSATAVLLPGYASGPAASLPDEIELLSEHAKKYLAAARAVALKPEERPRRLVVSCSHLMGGQGHLGQLRAEAETVSLLGFNTVNAYSWGSLAPGQVNAVLKSYGLERRMLAVYAPPSYFALGDGADGALAKWAANQAAGVARMNGGSPADVVIHVLADEPGWYYPGVLRELRGKPRWLETFRAYLREQGLKPADLGRGSWQEVFPAGRSEARDLPSRRLYYWTMRFFPESAARGHRLARAALEKAFGHPLLTPVNWNNWLSRWYIPSPNAKVGNSPIIGPDTAFGMMNWLQSGRRGACTPWTEDWFGDQQAQHWSLYADLLRCSAAPGGLDFGGYVIGRTVGDHPAGARYRVLALVGHGAKAVDVYAWGPEPLFPGNCWSESWRSYRPVADALRLLGRGERLLYPGRPARGKVALFLPAASALWDADRRLPHYFQEIWPLHFALVHAGYAVDFVDETDLAGGALASRGYRVLYLTAPNVPVRVQEQVAAWVEGGGTLAVTPGAATADEYDTPADRLGAVLGLKARRAVRAAPPPQGQWEALRPTASLKVTDARVGKGEVALYGPVAALQTAGATVLAEVAGGGAAVTLRRHGKGAALAYGFFPGWQYWLTPDRTDTTRLPRGWGSAQRLLCIAPARLARTPRPVVLGRELVEACRLESDKGMAVVLLNWGGEPIPRLTVELPRVGRFKKVTSLEHGPVKAVREGDALRLTVPLRDVDVLLVE